MKQLIIITVVLTVIISQIIAHYWIAHEKINGKIKNKIQKTGMHLAAILRWPFICFFSFISIDKKTLALNVKIAVSLCLYFLFIFAIWHTRAGISRILNFIAITFVIWTVITLIIDYFVDIIREGPSDYY